MIYPYVIICSVSVLDPCTHCCLISKTFSHLETKPTNIKYLNLLTTVVFILIFVKCAFHKHKVRKHADQVEIRSRVLERVPIESLEKVISEGLGKSPNQKGATPTKKNSKKGDAPTEVANESVSTPLREEDKEEEEEEEYMEVSFTDDDTQASTSSQKAGETGEEGTVVHVILNEWHVPDLN